MRIILAALLLLMSLVASAQNSDSKLLVIAAYVTKRMPNGCPCIGISAHVPYRVGFRDASGILDHVGDARRLRQCSGACVGLEWRSSADTSTGIVSLNRPAQQHRRLV